VSYIIVHWHRATNRTFDPLNRRHIAVSQAAGYVLNDTIQQIIRAPTRIQNEITKQVTQLQ